MIDEQKRQPCDLAKHLSGLEEQVSRVEKGFVFTRDTFPSIPKSICTSLIETEKSHKYVDDCYRIDVVHFRAQKKTFRHMGLAILAVIFCPELPELIINLTGATSAIKSMAIRYEGVSPRAVFRYLTKPLSFEYHPEEIHENPWRDRRFLENIWPSFRLKYAGPDSWNHWEERDQIEGLGGDEASVLLASMLLNLGRNENKENVVKLETVLQYGGVSKFSPEVQFHLPESEVWPIRS